LSRFITCSTPMLGFRSRCGNREKAVGKKLTKNLLTSRRKLDRVQDAAAIVGKNFLSANTARTASTRSLPARDFDT
jgi:hypothetical protein